MQGKDEIEAQVRLSLFKHAVKTIEESVQRSVSYQIPGLEYQKVPGDGHCLFHAVGLHVNQDQAYLRQIVAAHLEHNKNDFKAFIRLPEGQTIENYIRAIREGEEWADHIEIEVLMRVLDRPIIIIGPNFIITNREALERGLRGEPIFVMYNGHNHYDAFLRAEGTPTQDIINFLTQSNKHSPIERQINSQLNDGKNIIKLLDELNLICETIETNLDTSKDNAQIKGLAQTGKRLLKELVQKIKAQNKNIAALLDADFKRVKEYYLAFLPINNDDRSPINVYLHSAVTYGPSSSAYVFPSNATNPSISNEAITINFNVPEIFSDLFVEREDLQSKINLIIQKNSNNKTKKLIITSSGGAGKTEFAKFYIKSSKQSIKAWFDAEDGKVLYQKFEAFRQNELIDKKYITNPSLDSLQDVKNYLEKHANWLIVFDNVNQYDDIKNYIPASGGIVLITTRRLHWWENDNIIPIDVMTDEQAILLFKKYIKLADNNIDVEKLDEEKVRKIVVTLLEKLPLAIVAVSGLIGLNHMTLDKYLEEYGKIDLANFKWDEQYRGDMRHAKTLTKTFELSFNYLHNNGYKEAFSLLKYCAYLHPTSISKEFLEQLFLEYYNNSSSNFNQTIRILLDIQIIKYDNLHQTYYIHSIVQDILRRKINDEGQSNFIYRFTQSLFKKNESQEIILTSNICKFIKSRLHKNVDSDDMDCLKHLFYIVEYLELKHKNNHSLPTEIEEILAKVLDIPIDPHGTYTQFNSAIALLSNFMQSKEINLGKSILNYQNMPPSILRAMIEPMIKALVRLVKKDGDWTNCERLKTGAGYYFLTYQRRLNILNLLELCHELIIKDNGKLGFSDTDINLLYLHIGMMQASTCRYKDAVQILHTFNESLPNEYGDSEVVTMFHYDLGMVYIKLADTDESLSNDKKIEYLNLGLSHLETANEILRKHSYDGAVLFLINARLSHCYKLLGNEEKRLRLYDTGVLAFIQCMFPNNNLSIILEARKNHSFGYKIFDAIDVQGFDKAQEFIQGFFNVTSKKINFMSLEPIKTESIKSAISSKHISGDQAFTWYTDEEITTLVNLKNNQIGEYLNDNQFLLTGIGDGKYPEEDSYRYFVLVAPAIDTHNSLPLDYFIDKSKQPRNSLAIFLERIVPQLSSLLVYRDSMNVTEFKSKLESILGSDISPNDREDTLNKIAVVLREQNFGVTTIQQKIQQLDQNSRKDIFDEIKEKIIMPGELHIKLLFPYNITQSHWLTGEIKIHRINRHYEIELTAHNPYGKGEILQDNYKILCTALEKKIKELHPVASFNFQTFESGYTPRQHSEDGDSCGVIVVEDLLKRVAGRSLIQANPYSLGAQELRQNHIRLIESLPEMNSFRIGFLNRHQPKLNDKQPVIISQAKNRSSLKNEDKIKSVFSAQLLSSFVLGKAIDNGDCFFDALAQILNKINNTNVNSDKYLRMLCHEFYLKNKDLVDRLNKSDYGGIDKGRDDYFFIQYTAEECIKDFNGRSPIWGRPFIEGRILCHQLNLEATCIIEVLENPETKSPIPSYHLVNKESYKNISENELQHWLQKSNIPCLVVEQNSLHFVPLFNKNSIAVKTSQNYLHEKLYADAKQQSLKELCNYIEKQQKTKPTLFISYTWGNQAHETWVEQFATDLQTAGCQVLLDRWQDRRGKDLLEFVEKVTDKGADYIIVVGSKQYLAKYNKYAQAEEQREHVVAIEVRLINYTIAFSRHRSDRVIPILLEGTAEESLPPLMRQKLVSDFTKAQGSDSNYCEQLFGLIRDIYRLDHRDKSFLSTHQQLHERLQIISKMNLSEAEKRYQEKQQLEEAKLAETLKEKIKTGVNPDPSYKFLLEKLLDSAIKDNTEAKEIIKSEMRAIREGVINPNLKEYLAWCKKNHGAIPYNASFDVSTLETYVRNKNEKEESKEGNIPKNVDKMSELNANLTYEYDDNDINIILEIKVKDIIITNVLNYVLGAIDNIVPNQLQRSIQNCIDVLKKKHPNSYNLLIPFNLGCYHWASLLIRLDVNFKVTEILYCDSLSGAVVIPNIIRAAVDAMWKNFPIKTIELLKQPDTYSSGVLAIANLLHMVQGEGENRALTISEVEELRRNDLRLIKEKKPKYFTHFYQKQLDNKQTVIQLPVQFALLNRETKFSPHEYKRVLEGFELASSLINSNVKKMLVGCLNDKKEYYTDVKQHLENIREGINQILKQSLTEKDKKIVNQLVNLFFSFESNDVSLTDIGESEFRLGYEEIKMIGELLQENHIRSLKEFTLAVDDQIKLDEEYTRKLENVQRTVIDEHENVRNVAIEVSSKQPSLPQDPLEKLVKLLQDERKDVRHGATGVLLEQPQLSEIVLEKLVRLLQDEHEDVRHCATEVLHKQSQLPEIVLEKLVRLLQDERESARNSAIEVLSKQTSLTQELSEKLGHLLPWKRYTALDKSKNDVANLEMHLVDFRNGINESDLNNKIQAVWQLNFLGKDVAKVKSIKTRILNEFKDSKSILLKAICAYILIYIFNEDLSIVDEIEKILLKRKFNEWNELDLVKIEQQQKSILQYLLNADIQIVHCVVIIYLNVHEVSAKDLITRLEIIDSRLHLNKTPTSFLNEFSINLKDLIKKTRTQLEYERKRMQDNAIYSDKRLVVDELEKFKEQYKNCLNSLNCYYKAYISSYYNNNELQFDDLEYLKFNLYNIEAFNQLTNISSNPLEKSIHSTIKKIAIEDLFSNNFIDDNLERKIIITAESGVGKTTLCHAVLWSFINGKLWADQFSWILYIPYRRLIADRYSNKSEVTIADIIRNECFSSSNASPEEINMFIDIFLTKFHKRVLFILDGYNERETNDKLIQQKIYDVIEKEVLQGKYACIFTARPDYLTNKRFSHSYQLRCFEKGEIISYVKSAMKNEINRETFLSLLKIKNSLLLDIVRAPINLVFFCKYFDEREIESSSIKHNSILDIFQNLLFEYTNHKEELINVTTKLAFDLIRIGRLVFNKDFIKNILNFEITDQAWNQLIKIPFFMKLEKDNDEHMFIHHTLQEFLGGYYLANTINEKEIIEFLRENKFQSNFQQLLIWTGACCYLNNDKTFLQSFLKLILSPPRDAYGCYEVRLFIKLYDMSDLSDYIDESKEIVQKIKIWIDNALNYELNNVQNNQKFNLFKETLKRHPKILNVSEIEQLFITFYIGCSSKDIAKSILQKFSFDVEKLKEIEVKEEVDKSFKLSGNRLDIVGLPDTKKEEPVQSLLKILDPVTVDSAEVEKKPYYVDIVIEGICSAAKNKDLDKKLIDYNSINSNINKQFIDGIINTDKHYEIFNILIDDIEINFNNSKNKSDHIYKYSDLMLAPLAILNQIGFPRRSEKDINYAKAKNILIDIFQEIITSKEYEDNDIHLFENCIKAVMKNNLYQNEMAEKIYEILQLNDDNNSNRLKLKSILLSQLVQKDVIEESIQLRIIKILENNFKNVKYSSSLDITYFYYCALFICKAGYQSENVLIFLINILSENKMNDRELVFRGMSYLSNFTLEDILPKINYNEIIFLQENSDSIFRVTTASSLIRNAISTGDYDLYLPFIVRLIYKKMPAIYTIESTNQFVLYEDSYRYCFDISLSPVLFLKIQYKIERLRSQNYIHINEIDIPNKLEEQLNVLSCDLSLVQANNNVSKTINHEKNIEIKHLEDHIKSIGLKIFTEDKQAFFTLFGIGEEARLRKIIETINSAKQVRSDVYENELEDKGVGHTTIKKSFF